MNEANIRTILDNPEVANLTVRRLTELVSPGASVTTFQYDPGLTVTVRFTSGVSVRASVDYGETFSAAALAFALLVERGLLSETIIESVINPSMSEGDIEE